MDGDRLGTAIANRFRGAAQAGGIPELRGFTIEPVIFDDDASG
jgi:hypothetical protein